jgi:tetratricopeptide (TPR) repeat protein
MKPALLLCCVLLGACSAQRAAPPVGTAEPAAAAVVSQIQQAQALVGQAHWSEADQLLRGILASREFPRLELSQQHLALNLASLAALETHDARRALALSQRACLLSEADARDWFTRMRAAHAAGEPKDAVLALSTLAQRWPAVLGRLEDYSAVEEVVTDLDKDGNESDRYELLATLHKIKFADEPAAAGSWWRQLCLLQLARGERASAQQTLARITDPYVLISIEADKRFDALRGESSRGSFEDTIETGIQAELRRAQIAPDRLEPMNRLATLLITCLRFQQALAVTDAVLEREDTGGQRAWRDYDGQYTGILERRAEALAGLERWPAAVAQLQAASRLNENGLPNVSQVIDLASTYASLGEPQQALTTLARITPAQVTPFGVMQIELVKLKAALALHDESSAASALAYLRSHQDDAVSAYQEALLSAQRDADGATLLIARLQDLKRRSDALVAIQVYSQALMTPADLEQQHSWRALIQRPDVQRAVVGVGRISYYALVAPGY